jgi:hypothetical protein
MNRLVTPAGVGLPEDAPPLAPGHRFGQPGAGPSAHRSHRRRAVARDFNRRWTDRHVAPKPQSVSMPRHQMHLDDVVHVLTEERRHSRVTRFDGRPLSRVAPRRGPRTGHVQQQRGGAPDARRAVVTNSPGTRRAGCPTCFSRSTGCVSSRARSARRSSETGLACENNRSTSSAMYRTAGPATKKPSSVFPPARAATVKFAEPTYGARSVTMNFAWRPAGWCSVKPTAQNSCRVSRSHLRRMERRSQAAPPAQTRTARIPAPTSATCSRACSAVAAGPNGSATMITSRRIERSSDWSSRPCSASDACGDHGRHARSQTIAVRVDGAEDDGDADMPQGRREEKDENRR